MTPPSDASTPGDGATPRHRAAGTALVLAGAVGLLLAGAGAVLIRRFEGVASGARDLGNFRARLDVAASRAGSPPFRFAVLGDVRRRVGSLAADLSYLRDRGDVAFAVQTGDLVAEDTPERYQVVLSTLRRVLPGFPLLVAPGAHDVARGGDSFPLYVGPREAAFVAGSCLFLVADNSAGNLEGERLAFVRENLRRYRPEVRRVFVFLHRPPAAAAGPGAGDDGELARLLQQYRVDRVFCGGEDGFRVTERHGTSIVSNGIRAVGDGAAAEGSLVEVEVAPDGVGIDRVTVAAGPTFGEIFDEVAIVHLRPLAAEWCGRVAWISVVVLLAGLALRFRFDERPGPDGRGPHRGARGASTSHGRPGRRAGDLPVAGREG